MICMWRWERMLVILPDTQNVMVIGGFVRRGGFVRCCSEFNVRPFGNISGKYLDLIILSEVSQIIQPRRMLNTLIRLLLTYLSTLSLNWQILNTLICIPGSDWQLSSHVSYMNTSKNTNLHTYSKVSLVGTNRETLDVVSTKIHEWKTCHNTKSQ